MTIALLVGLLAPQDSEEFLLLLDVEPFEVEGRGFPVSPSGRIRRPIGSGWRI